MIEVLRILLLIVLWALLIGSGLCAVTAVTASDMQIALIAIAVGLVCWIGIYALRKENKEQTPGQPPSDQS